MQGISFHSQSNAAPIVRLHIMLALVAVGYMLGSFYMSNLHGVGVGESKIGGALLKNFMLRVPQMVFFVLFWRLLYLTYVERAPDRFGIITSEVRVFLRDRRRILYGFATVAMMTCFLVGFAHFKNLIPTLNPFGWDKTLMELDRLLHFGSLPHEFVLPLFGGPFVLSFFTGLYNVWLFLMYMVLLIACFLRPGSLVRMQYLFAFVMTWAVGGSLIATLFSSVGPVYYENLGLGDTYDALLRHLDQHAETGFVTVRETQDLLWSFYAAENRVSGISAFPSMHVASSVLMALFAFTWTRLAGYLMSTFALIIMIGSVLLAWHYAVDGYAGLVIAYLSWRTAGWFVRLSVFAGMAEASR
jgi:PAP2 superfamily